MKKEKEELSNPNYTVNKRKTIKVKEEDIKVENKKGCC
jgi:hypothetical protein